MTILIDLIDLTDESLKQQESAWIEVVRATDFEFSSPFIVDRLAFPIVNF